MTFSHPCIGYSQTFPAATNALEISDLQRQTPSAVFYRMKEHRAGYLVHRRLFQRKKGTVATYDSYRILFHKVISLCPDRKPIVPYPKSLFVFATMSSSLLLGAEHEKVEC
jgi:hypothetical protein